MLFFPIGLFLKGAYEVKENINKSGKIQQELRM
jgi:hypothetical protein